MCIVCLERHRHITITLGENLYLNGYHLMSKKHEKEVLETYEQYLAYFLDNDMDGINSLVKFPITYIAIYVIGNLTSELIPSISLSKKYAKYCSYVSRTSFSCFLLIRWYPFR